MGLVGWENSERLQFIIEPVEEHVEVVPFAFKIGMFVGINSYNNTYIFDKLAVGTSSTANRKKVMFSQIFEGEEVPLFCELDFWDHSNRKALFWVRPKILYSNNTNIFYLYWDKYLPDNIGYLSETHNLPVSLFRNTNSAPPYDTTSIIVFDLVKVNNVYKLWTIGCDSIGTWSILYSESTNFIDWTIPTLVLDRTYAYAINGHGKGCVIYDEGTYKMWYSGMGNSNNWRILYCTSSDGVTWGNHQLAVDIGNTYYSSYYALTCTVIKLDNLYKMWYGGYQNGAISHVIYCESLDGLIWYGHQRVIRDKDLPGVNPYIKVSKVIYKDSLYMMWLDVNTRPDTLTSPNWYIYYCESINGIYWKNFIKFAPLKTEGVYDTLGTYTLTVLLENDNQLFIYGGINGANENFTKLLYSKSASLQNVRTASQEVWGADFFSVHHFNPSYGFIDSTNNRHNILERNNTTTSTSNLGNASILMQASNSYVDFGNDKAYTFDSSLSVIIFGKFNSGNVILNKTLYNPGSINLVRYDNIDTISLDEPLNSTNYLAPSIYLWGGVPDYGSGSNYIFNNKLYMSSTSYRFVNYVITDTFNIYRTPYTLSGDFDVQIDYSDISITPISHYAGVELSMASMDENSSYRLYVRAGYLNHNAYMWGSKGGSLITYVQRFSTFGSLRLTRVGTIVSVYTKDGDTAWLFRRSDDRGVAVDVYINLGQFIHGHYVTENIPVTMTSTVSNFIVNVGTKKDMRGIIKANAFCASIVPNDPSNNININMETPYFNDTWNTYAITRDINIIAGVDTILHIPGYGHSSMQVITSSTNTSNLLVGGKSNSINGNLSEVWLSNKAFTSTTITHIDSVLKDTLISISRYFVQGYVTEYNKALKRKVVVVYDTVTGYLVGITYSDNDTGYYYCEVPYSNECHIIALDGTKYNHIILGKVTPRQL